MARRLGLARLVALLGVVLLAPLGLTADQSAAPTPGSARPAQTVDYTLRATLDPVNRLLLGSGRVTWRNTSPVAATELRFHLYWNSWRRGSSWMRAHALAGHASVVALTDDLRGSIDLTTLKRVSPAGSVDLLARAHMVAPDDGNRDDQTVLAVPLDRPILPGETTELDLGWNAHIPLPSPQIGARGNYIFAGHWFPQLGVLDAAGWMCHQVTDTLDDVSDVGTYDVSLTAPVDWTVGATGREEAAVSAGPGMTTHRFVERDVRDFAWVASPDFVTEQQRFEQPGLPAVEMRLLLQPDHVSQRDRYFSAATAALASYGRAFGPYPYGHLTIVDPAGAWKTPAVSGPSDVSVYPALIMGGTRWSAAWKDPVPELAVVRDAGLQFLSGGTANDARIAQGRRNLSTYGAAKVLMDGFPDRYFARVERYFGGFVWWTYEEVLWSHDVDGRRLAINAMANDRVTVDYAVTHVSSQPTDAGSFDNAVVVERRGAGVFPVDVQVTFADGGILTTRWDGQDATHTFRSRRGAAVTTVVIDPDRALFFETNVTNNSWTARPQAHSASARWALRWLTWFEDVLLTYAFFA